MTRRLGRSPNIRIIVRQPKTELSEKFNETKMQLRATWKGLQKHSTNASEPLRRLDSSIRLRDYVSTLKSRERLLEV